MAKPRVIVDLHNHTFLCKHAQHISPKAYVDVANRSNLRGYAFCCHNPFPDDSYDLVHRMSWSQFDFFKQLYREQVAYAEQVSGGEMLVTLNLEVDWVSTDHEKTAAFVREHLQNFDCVLGSCHFNAPDEKEYLSDLPYQEVVREYYAEWTQAAASGLFQVMSHLDFYKRFTSPAWLDQNFELLKPLYLEALRVARVHDVVLEINCTPLTPTDTDFMPSRKILELAVPMGIAFGLGADAHKVRGVANRFRAALLLCRELGIRELHYFLKKQRHSYSVADALESLADDFDVADEEVRILASGAYAEEAPGP